jgi:hypothetical protein
MGLIGKRELSSQEAAWKVLGLPFKGSTHGSVFINTHLPHRRTRMLQPKRILDNLPDDSEWLFGLNIIDRYEKRPASLGSMNLLHFAATYKPVYERKSSSSSSSSSAVAVEEEQSDADEHESDDEQNDDREPPDAADSKSNNNSELPAVIELSNGLTMKRCARQQIIRTPYFSPDKQPEPWLYHLLLLHCPFRKEAELLDGHESIRAAFQHNADHMSLSQGLQNMDSLAQELEHATRRLDALAELEQLERDTRPQRDDSELNISDFLSQAAADRMSRHNAADVSTAAASDATAAEQQPSASSTRFIMKDDEYQTNLRSLNSDQREVVLTVKREAQARMFDEPFDDVNLFISGGAGTGKSFVVRLLANILYRLFSGKIVFKVLAPTGVAAYNANGATIHCDLALPIDQNRNKSGFVMPPLSGERLLNMRKSWRNVWIVFIDEISMVSVELLYQVSLSFVRSSVRDRE